jgi:hypothetical protein
MPASLQNNEAYYSACRNHRVGVPSGEMPESARRATFFGTVEQRQGASNPTEAIEGLKSTAQA